MADAPTHRPETSETLRQMIESMRSERSRYKSHDLGFVDSVSSSRVDDWADDIEALLPDVESAAHAVALVEQVATLDPFVMDKHPFGRNLITVCAFCKMGSGEGHADGCLWLEARRLVDQRGRETTVQPRTRRL